MTKKEQCFNERFSSLGILERIPRFIDHIERDGSLVKVYMTMHFLRDLEVCCNYLACHSPVFGPKGLEVLIEDINRRRLFPLRVKELRIHVHCLYDAGFDFCNWPDFHPNSAPSSSIEILSYPL